MKRYSEFTFKLPALRVLENEHHLIRHLMSEWHPIVLAFEDDAYSIEEAHAALQELRKKIIEFLDPLKNHTEKEEAHMFKMLIKYVGDEQGLSKHYKMNIKILTLISVIFCTIYVVILQIY